MTEFARITASFELAPPPTERIAHRRQYDLRVTREEAVLLWRLRKRLQAGAPPGKTVSADDALRYLLRSCVGAADAEDAGAEIDPAPADVTAVEQAAVGTIFDEVPPIPPAKTFAERCGVGTSEELPAHVLVRAALHGRESPADESEARVTELVETLPAEPGDLALVSPAKPPAKSRRKK